MGANSNLPIITCELNLTELRISEYSEKNNEDHISICSINCTEYQLNLKYNIELSQRTFPTEGK